MAEKRINGRIYKYEQLPAWEAYDALMLLLDVIGPISGILDAAMEPNESHRKVMMASALAAMIRQRDDAAMRGLIRIIVENTRCDGERCVIGVKPHTLDEMLQVAVWACEVQFADFFAGAAVKQLGQLVWTALNSLQMPSSEK